LKLKELLNDTTGMVLGVAATGVSLYWMFAYSGPYRYFAELQIKWFGSYIPKFTLLVTIVAVLGAATLIRIVMKTSEGPALGSPPIEAATGSAPTALVNGVLRYARYGILLLPFGLGGYAYYNGTQARDLQQLSAEDFQNGSLHARVVYADVRGRLSGQFMNRNHYLYIPMTASGKVDGPLHLLVGLNENELRTSFHREADGSVTIRGIVEKGLEGDVKYAFEKNGLTVGEPCWVMSAGREPSGDRKFGLVMIGVGIVFAGLMIGVDVYRKKRNLVAPPLQVTT